MVGRAVLQQHAEFVAPEPRQRVSLAQLALQESADLAQQIVAGRVAARVVDLLEAVEIEVEHRMATVALRGAFERPRQPMLELTPVREPGQRIVARLVRQLLGEAANVGDIVEHKDRADRRTVAIADRRRRRVDADFTAIAPHEDRVAAKLDAAPLLQQRRHRIDLNSPVGLVDDPEHFLERTAARLGARPSRQRLRRRIERLDTALLVGGDDAFGNRLQRDLRAVLLGVELRLGLLAIGDVGDRAGHPGDLAIRIPHRLSARLEPSVLPRAGTEPEFVGIGRAVRTMLVERGLAHRPVVGMEAIQEGLERVGEFVVRVAQQLLVARRVVDVPAAEVPVPDARIAAIHREVEALLAHAQRVLQRIARAQHPPRERDAGDDERARGEYQRDFENSLRPPRRLAQRAGERDLQRRKPPVGVVDPRENRLERCRLVVAGDDARVQVLRGGVELGDVARRLRPRCRLRGA